MRLQATYEHTFKVTREVEIDDGGLADWREFVAKSGRVFADDLDAARAYLNSGDDGDEIVSATFPDWKTNDPLPSDFEFQYFEVIDVERVGVEDK